MKNTLGRARQWDLARDQEREPVLPVALRQ